MHSILTGGVVIASSQGKLCPLTFSKNFLFSKKEKLGQFVLDEFCQDEPNYATLEK